MEIGGTQMVLLASLAMLRKLRNACMSAKDMPAKNGRIF